MISIADQRTALKDQQSVEDRRERIYAIYLKGSTEREIAEAVGVNQSTVSRAIEVMNQRNREWFRQHWVHAGYAGSLLKEQKDRMMGLVREAWILYNRISETDVGRRIQALALVKSTLKDLSEMLGLQLPSLSAGPDNFAIDDQPEVLVEETAGLDTTRESVPG